MRKSVYVTLAASLVVALSGCATSTPAVSVSASKATASASSAVASSSASAVDSSVVAKFGQTSTWATSKVSVKVDYEGFHKTTGTDTPSHKQFAQFKVTVTNNGSEKFDGSFMTFPTIAVDGNDTESVYAAKNNVGGSDLGTILPGNKATFRIGAVAKSGNKIQIEFTESNFDDDNIIFLDTVD